MPAPARCSRTALRDPTPTSECYAAPPVDLRGGVIQVGQAPNAKAVVVPYAVDRRRSGALTNIQLMT